MLGIKKTYDAETGILLNVAAMNDCNFDYHSAFDVGAESLTYLNEGFASFGTKYKDNPVHCRKAKLRIVYEIYKNCNDEIPMFVAEVSGEGVSINENS